MAQGCSGMRRLALGEIRRASGVGESILLLYGGSTVVDVPLCSNHHCSQGLTS